MTPAKAELQPDALPDEEPRRYLAAIVPPGRVQFIVPVGKRGWGAYLEAEGFERVRCVLGEDMNLILQSVAPPEVVPTARPGVVALVGRAWTDDGGPFYPLATTLLWAVGGQRRGDGDRVRRHFSWFASQGINVVRILGQVDWDNEEIDPAWPDYERHLATVIDDAYDRGLRVKLTAVGGGAFNREQLADKIINVVRPRRRKVALLEAVNEDNASEADAIYLTQRFKELNLPVAVGLGDQGAALVRVGDGAGSTVDCIHTERSEPSERQVRQAWDFHDKRRAGDMGEPPGPGSSVAQLLDPQALAMMRWTGALCGAGMFCLHTGAGVFGRAHTTNGGVYRPANVWEVPGIAGMLAAVRALEGQLPLGMENWEPFNTNFEVDRTSGRCDKIYGARRDGYFVEAVLGASALIGLTPTVGCVYDVFDPSTGAKLVSGARGAVEVSGAWGYIISGRRF